MSADTATSTGAVPSFSFIEALITDPVGFATKSYATYSVELVHALKNFQFGTNFSTILTSTSPKLNFNIFLSWVLVFLALYVVFAILLKLFLSADSKLTKGKLPFLTASRLIGMVHCFLVVPLSIIALNQRNSDWLNLEYLDTNAPMEVRMIELSVGYFTADFVHFLLFEPDILFFFHHLFSILMMSSAATIGRGGASAAAAIVQGEITNPFQSAWTIARFAGSKSWLNVLSPLFTIVFLLARLLLVPFWTGLINVCFWTGPYRALMPKYFIEWWSGMSVAMTVGGFLWSYSLVIGLKKFYKKKAEDKAKLKANGKKIN